MDKLSNYELLYLLTTYGRDGAEHFMNFLAVFSAFLVAGYAAATKVSRTVLHLVSGFYIIVSVLTANGQFICLTIVADISTEIASRGLTIGPGASMMGPTLSGASGEVGRYLSPATQLLACLGSVVFVLHHRARGETPKAV